MADKRFSKPYGFPRKQRFFTFPAVFGDVSGPGVPGAWPSVDGLKTGHAGHEAAEVGYLDSHLLQNPLRGIAVRAPVGSVTDVSYGFRNGPTGTTEPSVENTGVYSPASNQVGIVAGGSKEVEVSSTTTVFTHTVGIKDGEANAVTIQRNGSTARTQTLQDVDDTFAYLGDIPAAYTDEQAQDAVGGMVADTATIDLTYTDATPELKADVKADSITNALLAEVAAYTLKANITGSTANPTDAALADFTEEATPAANDFILGWLDTGELRKFNCDNFLGGGSSHALLDGSVHTDTAADAVTKGSMIVGNATPAWDEFAVGADGLGVVADSNQTLGVKWAAPVVKGHIWDLTMSNAAGDPAKDITVAAGQATDESGVDVLVLSASITKQLDAAWAVGTNAGGLNTGSIAANTWYEVHIIKRVDTGVVDVMFTTAANRATLPANYTLQRRIGWIRTDATPDVRRFTQIGDYFTLTTQINDLSTTATASAAAVILTVPPSSIARFRASITSTTAVNTTDTTVFSEIVEGNVTPSDTTGIASLGANDIAGSSAGHFELRVDSSSQIEHDSDGTTYTFDISTFGWIDDRRSFRNA